MRNFALSFAVLFGVAALCLASGPTRAACSSPAGVAGDIMWNKTTDAPAYCNDTDWIGFPRSYPSSVRWEKLTDSFSSSCGLMKDGSIWCWGSNNSQIFANGQPQSQYAYAPQKSTNVGPWRDMSLDGRSICAIKTADDTLWCWGNADGGRLGNGVTSSTIYTSPVQVTGGGTWSSVTGGNRNHCGIKTDGTAWCWGSETFGELGNGGATSSTASTPSQVTGGGTWRMLQTSSDNTCGIKDDDTAWCWGTDAALQLGNGATTTTAQSSPVQVNGTGWSTLSLGQEFVCGIKTDSTLWCWGSDMYDKLGDGAGAVYQSAPVQVTTPSATGWESVNLGNSEACATRDGGEVWCWGRNLDSQTGIGTYTNNVPVPTKITVHPGPFKRLTGRGLPVCAIDMNDNLACWGLTFLDRASAGATTQIPNLVATDGTWVSITGGYGHICGLKDDGTAWCMGDNWAGQIGDGTTNKAYTMTQISGGGTWTSITAGLNYTCGIRPDDKLYCWGDNTDGATGLGVAVGEQHTPQEVSGGGTWSTVDAGAYSTCGVKTDGSGWCWGADDEFVLGNGSGVTANQSAPYAIGVGTWRTIRVASSTACGIQTDGSAWCWGADWAEQLGDGTGTVDQEAPVAVTGGYTWLEIAPSDYHTCGLRSDGRVMCWGADWNGELGLGSITYAEVGDPGFTADTATYVHISSGGETSCGVRADQTGVCWGADWAGEAGNDWNDEWWTGETYSGMPTVLAGDVAAWSVVEALSTEADSVYRSCGISASGRLYCWGNAFAGADLYGYLHTESFNMINRVCANPAGEQGDIIYNQTSHVLQYCGAGVWNAAGEVGDGGTGCVTPAGVTGDIVYNSSFNALQYCEGDVWVRIGREP